MRLVDAVKMEVATMMERSDNGRCERSMHEVLSPPDVCQVRALVWRVLAINNPAYEHMRATSGAPHVPERSSGSASKEGQGSR